MYSSIIHRFTFPTTNPYGFGVKSPVHASLCVDRGHTSWSGDGTCLHYPRVFHAFRTEKTRELCCSRVIQATDLIDEGLLIILSADWPVQSRVGDHAVEHSGTVTSRKIVQLRTKLCELCKLCVRQRNINSSRELWVLPFEHHSGQVCRVSQEACFCRGPGIHTIDTYVLYYGFQCKGLASKGCSRIAANGNLETMRTTTQQHHKGFLGETCCSDLCVNHAERYHRSGMWRYAGGKGIHPKKTILAFPIFTSP